MKIFSIWRYSIPADKLKFYLSISIYLSFIANKINKLEIALRICRKACTKHQRLVLTPHINSYGLMGAQES